jgi:hypothetical protein
MYLKCTGGGQACTVTLAPNTISKVWIISNETSFTLTFTQGSGANVAVAAGAVKMIVTDGAGATGAVTDALSGLSANLSGLTTTGIDVTGTVTATAGAFESTGATEITLEDTDGGFAASKINVQNGGRDLKVTAPQDIIFNVGSSDAVTILNGGSVGIGTSSVSAPLHLKSSTANAISIQENGSATTGTGQASRFISTTSDVTDVIDSNGYYRIGSSTNPVTGAGFTESMRISGGNVKINDGYLEVNTETAAAAVVRVDYNSTDSIRRIHALETGGGNARPLQIQAQDVRFRDDTTERMRLSGGNLLVGTTTTTAGNEGMVYFNGSSLRVTRDSDEPLNLDRLTTDGTIAVFKKDGTPVGSIGSIAGGYLSISGTTGGRLQINGTDEYAWDTTQFYPTNDNANDLGFITKRWDDIYATNGTIQTSDRNEKQDIEALSDAEQRVAVAAKGLLRKFRWISSVEENGDDARIHFGIIAQDLQDAFTAEGLDAGRYAMFISNTWTDDDGNEHTRLGVRYSELLAFIISAI